MYRYFANDPYMMSTGVRVITDPAMTEQYRFPRSKSKRIRLKWKKDKRNYRPARHAMVDNRRGVIYCHPSVAEAMRRQFQQRAI